MKRRRVYRLIVLWACLFAVGPFASADQVIKLGYVDMKRVFNNYFKTEAASKDLEQQYENLRQQIKSQEDKVKRLGDELELKRAVLSKEQKDKLENEIRDKLNELKSFATQADAELRTKTSDRTRDIVKEIQEVIQQIGTREGYTVIFDKAVVLYAAPAFDLTEKVLDELNRSRPADQSDEPSTSTDAN